LTTSEAGAGASSSERVALSSLFSVSMSLLKCVFRSEPTMAKVTEIRPDEQVLLIAVLKQSLDAASTQEMVDDVQTAAAERPGVPVVIDLSQVRFAPSVALGSFIQLSKGLRIGGRRIALIGVSPRIMEAIGVTRLDTVLEIHDTLEQVLRVPPETS
jgi:anti-anti-sigma factor